MNVTKSLFPLYRGEIKSVEFFENLKDLLKVVCLVNNWNPMWTVKTLLETKPADQTSQEQFH